MKRAWVLVFTIAAAVGCGQQAAQQEPAASPEARSTVTSEKHEATAYTIAVAPKGLVHQFWQTVRAGAEAAGKDFNAKIVWNGPPKETEVERQISIIEDMINSGVNAIVMAACHEKALIDVLKKATDKGIPVVTIDSGVVSDIPVSFVATDNVAGAKAAAQELARLVGEEGPVGIIPFVRGAATSDLREQGFNEGIAAFPKITVIPPRYSQSDAAIGMNAMQDMMTAQPDLKGVFAANEAGAIGAAAALKAAGKVGQIKMVAFDASEEEINGLKEGAIQALIVQNPFKMGYEGVKAAVDHLQGKPVEKRIDTGVTVVTLENLNQPEIQKLLYPLAPHAKE